MRVQQLPGALDQLLEFFVQSLFLSDCSHPLPPGEGRGEGYDR